MTQDQHQPEGEPRETAAPPAGPGDEDVAGAPESGGSQGFGEAAAEMAPETEVEGGSAAGGQTQEPAAEDQADLRTQLAERTLDLQRLQAEYVNYKRRVDRDRELVKQNATFAVLSSMLPVLDDIDRAREHGELEGGFKAVAESLERVVSGLGLTKYAEQGDAFDPTVHEALMHGHSPDVTSTVVDVVAQAGYRIGDRVVRAAKVTVLDPEQ